MIQNIIIEGLITIKDTVNNNAGVVSAVSPIVAYWLGIKTIKKTEGRTDRRHRRNLDLLLLEELYINMVLLSDIERIFNKNKHLKEKNLYIPTKSPRITIIEKYTNHNIISSLDIETRRHFIDTYSSLTLIEKEYYEWRRFFSTNSYMKLDDVIFDQLSLPMSTALSTSLSQVINLWVLRVKQSGMNSDIQFIKDLSKSINKAIKEGKWLKTYYKASEYLEDINSEKVDIIVCWENDIKEGVDKEIIEIKGLRLVEPSILEPVDEK